MKLPELDSPELHASEWPSQLTILHRITIGCDVHKASITACVLFVDENGETHREIRRFRTFKRDLREFAQWVLSFRPNEVFMESSGIFWKSPYAYLEKVGIRAKVVNARHFRGLPGRKTDVCDAEWLAFLGRSGLLRSSFVPPVKLRELRVISRQRQKVVQELASSKNRLNKTLSDCGVRLGVVVSDIHGVASRSLIWAILDGNANHEFISEKCRRLRSSPEELFESIQGEISESHRFVIRDLLTHIEYLEKRKEAYEQQLLSSLENERPYLDFLQTVPGIDLVGAAMLLVEIGTDMDEFGCAARLASWAGLCPGNNESAGKRKSGRITKGNEYVRRLLVEFAHAASRTKCAFQSKFKSLVVRRGYKRSIIAIAHQMLRSIFFMFKKGEYYRDSTIDYEALSVQKNAPRWIKLLKKHNKISPLTQPLRTPVKVRSQASVSA